MKIIDIVRRIIEEHGDNYTEVNGVISIPADTPEFPNVIVTLSFPENNDELVCRTEIKDEVPRGNLNSLLHYISRHNVQHYKSTLHYDPRKNRIYFRAVNNFPAIPDDDAYLSELIYNFIRDGYICLHTIGAELLPYFNTQNSGTLLPLFSNGTAISALLQSHSDDDLFRMTNKSISELSELIRGNTQVIIMNTLDPQYAKFIIQAAAKSLNYAAYFWNSANHMRIPVNFISTMQISEGDLVSLFQSLESDKDAAGNYQLHNLLTGTTLPITNGEARELGAMNANLTNIPGVLGWFKDSIRNYLILGIEDLCLESMVYSSKYPDSEDRDIISKLRELSHSPQETKTLIIINQNQTVPKELVRLIPQINCTLPDRGTLLLWYNEIMNSSGVRNFERDLPVEILDALHGMTMNEAKSAISARLCKKGEITIDDSRIFEKEKMQHVNRTDYLRYLEIDENITDIGGMDVLKEWIRVRAAIQSNEMKSLGVQPPKGILLVGPPGTGKTLAAKTIAKMWHRPLLELEIGALYGPLMGDSEHQTQNALANIDSFSPCVLLIDELDKGLGGMEDPHPNETSQRVIAMILKWMQNRESDVFLVATSNSVASLPPEVLRKGRFDEIFFVDLPTQKERVEILSIHLKKRGRKLFSAKEMNSLAEISEGYSGTELEHAVEGALIKAFSEKRKLKAEDIVSSIKATPPLSQRDSEKILGSRISGRKYGLPVSAEKPNADSGYDASLGYR